MDAPSSQPTAKIYRYLGRKTFWLFVFNRISAAAVILLVAAVLLVLGQSGALNNVFKNLNIILFECGLIGVGAAVIVFGVTLLISWLIYANYKFLLDNDALKIKRGVFEKEEIAIPYRQIQNVDIERDLSYQLLGLSRLVILTAGHEEVKGEEDESEGILPALDKDLAEGLQKELLERANVQKVTESK